ncbi:hypothetical protein [Nocardioides marmoriginsengisoli]|uniref:hypothetical protein n=1 Tax=Nocardioides marmoriginsengisoli TaxID=661483 RepID=UPI00161D870C|nr:hypothetical protein [Nocardioides marmoriginsengisoli]
MPADSLADRLLDAQVGWLLGQLTGPGLPDAIARDVDALLAIGSRATVGELVDAGEVKQLARLIVTAVPPSTAASTLVATAADVAYDGPTESFALADLIDRENVESLVDEALGMTDLAERFLDELTASPLVATLASRFVGRIVGDMVQANQAMADKIPGLGSLVSFGTSAAGKVVGAADKQLQQVLGDTAGKGAAFAMRRLNKVVIDTLKDPTARDAVLEVFDLYADKPVVRLDQLGDREDARRVAGLLQDIVIAGAPTEPVLALVDALIDGFFSVYGDSTATTLVEELGLTRDDLVGHAQVLVPRIIGAAHEAGELEPLLRARLEPFFSSPEVAAILA